jgi:hypothetical protein
MPGFDPAGIKKCGDTRNVRDFETFRVEALNPFKGAWNHRLCRPTGGMKRGVVIHSSPHTNSVRGAPCSHQLPRLAVGAYVG